ncbi:VWA containing CoxE-like protein [Halobacteriales archaeon QS_8_69_26]|nr:MAG: VWA containing CoxE-like protein [Halobacteriales archaeon QS_8_69_26]
MVPDHDGTGEEPGPRSREGTGERPEQRSGEETGERPERRSPGESSGSGPAAFDAGSPGEVPDFVAARDHVRSELVRFARALRRAGAAVPANAATEAARALVETGFEEDRARPALRATLVTRREDLATFERAFPEFWRRLTAGLDATGPADRPGPDAPDGGLAPLGGDPPAGEAPDPGDASDDGDGEAEATISRLSDPGEVGGVEDGEDEEATASVYSRSGRRTALSVPPSALRFGEGDLAGPMRELTRALSGLQGRRWVGGEGPELDPRKALRESFGTGGTVLNVPRRARAESDVRALLLVDVSQSVLDTLDRGFLLRFLHRARAAWRAPRVFFFDEEVREVTDEFDAPTVGRAVAALERAEAEWGGGTRIGSAVRTVTDTPGAVDRVTVVFVVSDGLEVGDVADLERGMADLSRRAAAVLWCNPLAASPEYEPACRGMEAALPYVDGLFSFAGPDDVAEMARQLRLRGPGGSVGYEYDPRRDRDGRSSGTAPGSADGSTPGPVDTDSPMEVDNA